MHIMQQVWKLGSSYTIFKKSKKSYQGHIPAVVPITIIFCDENYAGYVEGHLIKPKDFHPLDLKLIALSKVYTDFKTAEVYCKGEMKKFLALDDDRTYWADHFE